jgi:anthranilate phosphoribosyltransferase
VRTIFNFLGPLTNPAGAKRQLLGVSDRTYQETIAEALIGLGCERALVVAAEDGMDELSINSATRVIEVADGKTEEWFARAEELGLQTAPIDAIAGGEPADNAKVVEGVLAGDAGPALDVALLNGGAAILVAGGADDLAGGIEKARESISSGAAKRVLDKLVARTGELAG